MPKNSLTKRQKYKKCSEKRLRKAEMAIMTLQTISDKRYYEYTEEEANNLNARLQHSLNKCRLAFDKGLGSDPNFKFSNITDKKDK